jgi:hypothetical protein
MSATLQGATNVVAHKADKQPWGGLLHLLLPSQTNDY